MGRQWRRIEWTREELLSRCNIRTNGCWEWMSPTRNKKGEPIPGSVIYDGLHMSGSKVAYILWMGHPPDGMALLKGCGNKVCCNPWHMSPETKVENLRKRAWKTVTHCKRGHEYTPENTLWQADKDSRGGNSRLCRACRAQWFRDMRARKKLGAHRFGISQTADAATAGRAEKRTRKAVKVWDIEALKAMCHITDNGCWEWPKVDAKGYPYRKSFNGKNLTAPHRYAFTLVKGPIGAGLQLDHLCRNRSCINPKHLDDVPGIENMRRAQPFRKILTHCKRGHEFTPENTGTYRNTHGGWSRQCKACARIRKGCEA